jgi:hypothetical protein
MIVRFDPRPEGFLLRERSVMPSSAGKYLKAAGRFLSNRFSSRKVYLKRLRARDVTDFLLHDTANRSRRSRTEICNPDVRRGHFSF